MGINHVRDHKGRSRIQLSKRWPDGSRFRRYFSNVTVARKTLSRIEESITMGTWRKLQEELTHGREAEITIAQFAKTYLSDYCRAHNTRPDFKEQALVPIVRYLGKVPLKLFRRKHAHQFVAKRSQEVAPATVNRNVAVLKHMLTFALEREYIESHPLVKFRMLPEERKALRVMTLQEERRLVEVVAREEPTIGAYVAVLGETALRKSEGLLLKWSHVDLRNRMLSVEETKSGKPRYIPLTEYAVLWLNSLVRIIDCPWVFACLDTQDRLRDPRGPFERARKVAPGVGRFSRSAALSGNPMGDAGSGSSDGPGTPGPFVDHHDHALCPLRSRSCLAGCAPGGATGGRRTAGQKRAQRRRVE